MDSFINEHIAIHNKSCFDLLPTLPRNSINTCITSPPYANKRKGRYDSIHQDEYAAYLMRFLDCMMPAIRDDGSVFLNVKEGVDGGVRQTYIQEFILMAAKKYLWIDTFIWHKTNPYPTGATNRLKDGWEHIFHFAKRPGYKFYPDKVSYVSESKHLQLDKRRKNLGEHNTMNGSGMNMSSRPVDDVVRPSNVLMSPTSCLNIPHCAAFPKALPEFFVLLSTESGDMVCDPFLGSGTTALVAKELGRRFVGCENNVTFFNLCVERVSRDAKTLNLFA